MQGDSGDNEEMSSDGWDEKSGKKTDQVTTNNSYTSQNETNLGRPCDNPLP